MRFRNLLRSLRPLIEDGHIPSDFDKVIIEGIIDIIIRKGRISVIGDNS